MCGIFGEIKVATLFYIIAEFCDELLVAERLGEIGSSLRKARTVDMNPQAVEVVGVDAHKVVLGDYFHFLVYVEGLREFYRRLLLRICDAVDIELSLSPIYMPIFSPSVVLPDRRHSFLNSCAAARSWGDSIASTVSALMYMAIF